jgi:hypothetical protein
MSKLVYHIVEHDGGWAYQADGAYSETFPSHDAARAAAQHAAQQQRRPGEETVISFEDAAGKWHEEAVSGGDRPETDVEG